MGFPIAKVQFSSMAGFQADDTMLLTAIPPFMTVKNNNGDNSWAANLSSLLEGMYLTARGVEATVTVNQESNFITVTPKDKGAYEVAFSLSRAQSDFEV
jgi:hypothetical protein